jgi:large subunit ribosomal protein L10
MNRQQKEAVVAQVKSLFQESQAAFLVEYKGATVAHLQTMRRLLMKQNGSLKVTKARLMKIAADDINGIDTFKAQFTNQVGLVFASTNIAGVAKVLVDFTKDQETFKIISGFFERRVISAAQISHLASLPSREVLLAQVVGSIQAPLSSFVRVLQMMVIRLLYVLKQIAEQKEKSA